MCFCRLCGFVDLRSPLMVNGRSETSFDVCVEVVVSVGIGGCYGYD
nr:MAG TPA_asm: hypothetical protein [Caudoviricetes sp.]